MAFPKPPDTVVTISPRLLPPDEKCLANRIYCLEQASKELEEASIVLILWFIFLAVGLAVLLATLPTDIPTEYALFEVMSAQSTVGLSAGITGPEMPTAAKVVFLFNMWVGRLEIIPVLVLLRGAMVRTGLYR
ncbi:potassium transporter TrkG [Halomontanus rarus]|uniref:potassium transporter TrkG n=1 Tax=Halomontanus rarus TaxID=3034020 RepID=UPI003CE45DC0